MSQRTSLPTLSPPERARVEYSTRPVPLAGPSFGSTGHLRWFMRHLGRSEGGAAIVEFALVLPMLLTLVFGIVDFGILFTTDIATTNAVRSAARWATTHPTSWSNAATAPSNTIEGIIQSAGGAVQVPNDDSHITISYSVPGSGSATYCGQYSAAQNAFVAASGYSQSTCVAPGNFINVQVTYTYTFVTPVFVSLFPNGLILSTSSTMVEEL